MLLLAGWFVTAGIVVWVLAAVVWPPFRDTPEGEWLLGVLFRRAPDVWDSDTPDGRTGQ